MTINKLIKKVKVRLNSSGKHAGVDEFGNQIFVDCDIFTVEQLVTFLCNSLSAFNQIPHFTYFSFEDAAIIDQFCEVIVQHAHLTAMASKALIERGREFNITDNGANSGISFENGQMRLQSRGHYLIGGPRERHFDLLKQWASVHEYAFRDLLGERYVMYGEYMLAKHTVYYDALQHYFAEFDILDKETGVFLSTKARQRLLEGFPITSVGVLWEGQATSLEAIVALMGPSLFKTKDWRDSLAKQAQASGVEPQAALEHTDKSDFMEGLYIKVETENEVVNRLKYVRADFFNSIMDQEEHWLNRKIIPNTLADGVDIWSQ